MRNDKKKFRKMMTVVKCVFTVLHIIGWAEHRKKHGTWGASNALILVFDSDK